MTKKTLFVLRLLAALVLIALMGANEMYSAVDWSRILTLVLLLVLLVDLASLTRGKLRDLLIISTSLVFGLCLAEGWGHVFDPRELVSFTEGLWKRRPVIGWGPGHAGIFHAEKRDPSTGALIYSVDYTIDSNLLRQTRSSDRNPAIAFFGDSYTFGLGVEDSETLPQAFADVIDRNQRVLNLAFNGYGPQQFLRTIETGHFDEVIGPSPSLFVFLTIAWHAERTACKSSWTTDAPAYALEQDSVVFKGSCHDATRFRIQRRLWDEWAAYRHFVAPYLSRPSHGDIDLYIRILLAAVKGAKEKYGVPTLILYVRTHESYFLGTGFDNDTIIARLRDGGALVLDASLPPADAEGTPLEIPGDGHPNGSANRLRALSIKDYVEKHLAEVLVSSLR